MDDMLHAHLELMFSLLPHPLLLDLALFIAPTEMVAYYGQEHPVPGKVDICSPALLLQAGTGAGGAGEFVIVTHKQVQVVAGGGELEAPDE
jgi:hypothetical protein